jgi:hypothetical protein
MILALAGGAVLCLLAALLVRLVNDIFRPSELNTWLSTGGHHGKNDRTD